MRFLSRSARFSAKSRRAAQGHESGQDSTGFLHCGGTSGKVPINQTIHHLILIVCQRGKVPLIGKLPTLPAGHKFATLAKFVLRCWYADILELGHITCVARGVVTERVCRCRQASASKKIPQQNARKTRIFLEICLRRLQTGPKCGKMIHGYLMTTT